MKLADGQEKRKLQLLVKETTPGELFQFLKHFHASWQHEQLGWLLVTFFQMMSAASMTRKLLMHISKSGTIVVLLPNPSVDPCDSSSQTRFFSRHPWDRKLFRRTSIGHRTYLRHLSHCKHDQHSVHQCRTLIDEYLRKIKYQTKFEHKFTDGRSAQYKSCHCKGDVSFSVTDLRYLTICNFCETSHAKRPQDGAGVNLKHKADMAIHQETSLNPERSRPFQVCRREDEGSCTIPIPVREHGP